MINPTFLESCFGENYIGIRGYCDDESDSGYYINDEVNISQKAIAKLANSDDVKSIELVHRLIRNAVRDTCNDFLQYLDNYGNYLTKNINYCSETSTTLNKQLQITRIGRYMAVKIEFIEVAEDVNLYIDIDGVRTIIALTTGVNRLNKILIGDAINLHFFADNSIISAAEIPDKRINFTTILVENESESGLTSDVTFKLTGICSFEKLICENKQLLARSIFLHAVGLFFKEKWQSDKIDPFISNSKEESEKLYYEYLFGFEDKKSKYHEALIFAVKGLRQNLKENHCFICTGIKVQSLI